MNHGAQLRPIAQAGKIYFAKTLVFGNCPRVGRNFYFHEKGAVPLHVGKSSAGWCFALRIYPDRELNDLDDWIALFRAQPKTPICDCSDHLYTWQKLNAIVTIRSWNKPRVLPPEALSWPHFHEINNSEIGPNNLFRARVTPGGPCVRHGFGTWDLFEGEFS